MMDREVASQTSLAIESTHSGVRVCFSLGSNFPEGRERYLQRGIDALRAELGGLQLSPVVESDGIGAMKEPFYNLAIACYTTHSLSELRRITKKIELDNHRTMFCGFVTLDIDLLLYGDLSGSVSGISLPHPDVTTQPHVVVPLYLLNSSLRIPGSTEAVSSVARRLGSALEKVWPANWHPV